MFTHNQRPRVLIIAPHGSYRTFAYIQAAEKLGVATLIASEGKHSIISAYAQGLHIDFSDMTTAIEVILTEARRAPFVAVIGTDDGTTEIASQVAQQLGLPHNDPRAVQIARRKDLARDALQRAGVSKPAHRLVDLTKSLTTQLVDVSYPVVVKPVALSGSRGVIRADNSEQLHKAMTRIQNILRTVDDIEPQARQRLLIEKYIPGREVAVEAMLNDGQLLLLAIFDKPDPLVGPYFEETYYITPTNLSDQQQQMLVSTIAQACHAYGLRHGPIHAECRVNDAGVFILEVAARTIGGMCARLLNFGTGYSLEELVLTQAMGKTLSTQMPSGAAGVLMIPIPKAGILKRVEGILDAQRIAGIEDIDIQVREGYEVTPLPEGASYLGFIFARGDDAHMVEVALRQAHAALNFVIAPVWKLANVVNA